VSFHFIHYINFVLNLSNPRSINFGVEAVLYSSAVLFQTLSLVILFTYAVIFYCFLC